MKIDLAAMKEVSRLNRFHYRVIVLCLLLMLLDGFDLIAITYVAGDIAKQLSLTPQQLGFVFSAGVAGAVVGAAAIGLLGDRWGRRPAATISCLVFGLGTLATAWAETMSTLIAWRLVAGIGLGGATPIALTLAADIAPRRLRGTLSLVMYCGFVVGGLVGGAVSAVTTPSLGWQALFYIGGGLTLALVPVLMLWLPEPADSLIRRGRLVEAGETLRRMSPGFQPGPDDTYQLEQEATRGASVAALFRSGRAIPTLLLWLTFLCSFTALYFYANWLPGLLRAMGLSQGQSIAGTVAGQCGNLVFAILLARLMIDRPIHYLLAVTYAMGGVMMLAISAIGGKFGLQVAANLFAGAFIAGSLGGLYALSPLFYPSEIRATGSGWAIGIGRIGAILGPIIAGALLSRQWTPAELFQLAAVPPVLAGFFCWRLGKGMSTRGAVASPTEMAR